MFDSFWRDAQERPLIYPFLKAYSSFMNIKRYDNFPFYVKPGQVKVQSFEDAVLKFLDHLVDAHELERNKSDHGRSFYQRALYFTANFHRYSNDTMANCMFDAQLSQPCYDRLNSTMDLSIKKFYLAATFTHVMLFSYAAFLLRYRRLNRIQTLAAGTGFYYAFGSVNSTLYSLIVDRNVISTAKQLGLGDHVQANGSHKPRGFNY